ncbi:hypothetical protein ALC53_06548 [Atta colombica]|uniref:Uncharacterized protein n=1 Tax=Atta colombica TaxID=520822 RepID=A0A195BEG7_9HYME|nr:hypothetical protein ALC53_06548 [Atta colombica]
MRYACVLNLLIRWQGINAIFNYSQQTRTDWINPSKSGFRICVIREKGIEFCRD